MTPVSIDSRKRIACAFGNRAHGELGLHAERVQARGVEDRQPVGEQRVRVVDHGVAPRGHFHQLLLARQLAVLVQHRREAQHAGLERVDLLGVGQRLQRLLHVGGRVHVQPHLAPLDRHVLQLRDRLVAVARLDRQELQVRLLGGVVEDLGRAHRGAADVGGQQPLLEAREEERVDQLGLAARELREEGEHQPALVQVLEQVVEADGLLDVQLAGWLPASRGTRGPTA